MRRNSITCAASGAEPDTMRRQRSRPTRTATALNAMPSHTECVTWPPSRSQYCLVANAWWKMAAFTPPASATPPMILS